MLQSSAKRRGISLLEIVFASAALAMIAIPIGGGIWSLAVGFKKTGESTHATFLAHSLIEGIRYRLYNGDSRFYKLNDSEQTREAAVKNRDYERFFRELAKTEGVRVVEGADGPTNNYFLEFENLNRTKLHGITREANPEVFDELAAYSARVEVNFEVPEELRGLEGDSKGSVDLVQVVVSIMWSDLKDGKHRTDFRTMLTRFAYEPYQAP